MSMVIILKFEGGNINIKYIFYINNYINIDVWKRKFFLFLHKI